MPFAVDAEELQQTSAHSVQTVFCELTAEWAVLHSMQHRDLHGSSFCGGCHACLETQS